MNTEPITPEEQHDDTSTLPIRPGQNKPTEDTTAVPVQPEPNRAERRAFQKRVRSTQRRRMRAYLRDHKAAKQFTMLDTPVMTAAAKRLAKRRSHDAALDALEARVVGIVSASLRKVMRTATLNLGDAITAAGADEVFDLDALSSITNLWGDEVDGPVGDAVAEVFVTGGMATWLEFPDSYAAAVAKLGERDSALSDAGATYLAAARNRLVGIGDTSWAMARRELEAGFRAGEGIDELRQRVANVLDVADSRAELIARTETIGAANGGAMAGQRALGEFSAGTKEWLATNDARTRESHVEADGQQVALDDYFSVGGSSLDAPGDPSGDPAEVCNCRCTVIFSDASGADISAEDAGFDDMLATASEGDIMKIRRVANVRGAQAFTSAGGAALLNALSQRTALTEDEAATEEIVTPPDSRPDTPMKDTEQADGFPPEEWHSLMVVEGVPTGDRRLIEQGALTWRDLPLPLMWQETQPESGGHALSVHVGQITRVERQGDEIHAWGFLLHSDPDGARFDSLLDEAMRLGVSVDMDDVDVEIDWPDEGDGEDPGMMLFAEPDLVRFTRARLMGVTSTPFPAFSEAFIEPINEDTESDSTTPADTQAALTAAAIPVAPPAEWFDNPRLDRLTPMFVGEDGRVFGHMAAWGSCHTGMQGMCVTPPTSASSYAYYLTGEVVCEGGERIAVGQLTMGTEHAAARITPQLAMQHYANTGLAVADITVGEDVYGIWFAGALRPGLSASRVRELRGGAPSGDWRRLGGSLELIANLIVNVQGYPVPRTSASVHGGVQTALVAAGVLLHEIAPDNRHLLDAIAERIAADCNRDRPARVAELVASVHPETTIGAFTCGCSKRKTNVIGNTNSRGGIIASAVPTRYEVRYPDGKTETVDTLLDARRKARARSGGVIKVI